MRKFSEDEVLETFHERTKSGPMNWEYAGNRWVRAYRLAFPDLCFVIRGALSGKEAVFVLEMTDSSGEMLGLAAGDSADPESPHYSELGNILRSARRQAGDPLMDEALESARQS